ncbi:MAG: hypothetical protein GY821_07440 [Gammaproteobacteria bacterium]|nr:hypothetical protein [Gammaproteobacteria bacterium]
MKLFIPQVISIGTAIEELKRKAQEQSGQEERLAEQKPSLDEFLWKQLKQFRIDEKIEDL